MKDRQTPDLSTIINRIKPRNTAEVFSHESLMAIYNPDVMPILKGVENYEVALNSSVAQRAFNLVRVAMIPNQHYQPNKWKPGDHIDSTYGHSHFQIEVAKPTVQHSIDLMNMTDPVKKAEAALDYRGATKITVSADHENMREKYILFADLAGSGFFIIEGRASQIPQDTGFLDTEKAKIGGITFWRISQRMERNLKLENGTEIKTIYTDNDHRPILRLREYNLVDQSYTLQAVDANERSWNTNIVVISSNQTDHPIIKIRLNQSTAPPHVNLDAASAHRYPSHTVEATYDLDGRQLETGLRFIHGSEPYLDVPQSQNDRKNASEVFNSFPTTLNVDEVLGKMHKGLPGIENVDGLGLRAS